MVLNTFIIYQIQINILLNEYCVFDNLGNIIIMNNLKAARLTKSKQHTLPKRPENENECQCQFCKECSNKEFKRLKKMR